MKKIANIFLILFSIILFQNCEEDQFESSLQFVTFGDTTYSTGVDVAGSTTVDVIVYTSKIVSSDVTFNVAVATSSNAAPGSYTVPGSVTVPSGSNKGTLTVALSDVNLGIGVNKLVLNFDSVTEGYGSGGSTTVEYIQNCNEVTGTLALAFDRWGSEVSWNIKDALGGVVASGGGYPDTGSGTSKTDVISVTLCAGRTYTLTTTDAYGDGWGAVGNYTLTIGGVVKVTGDSSLMDNGGTGTISATATFNTN
jgi:hypothetical protein